MSDSKFLILTCDGGGIRGLITAMVIQKLDEELHFLDRVDLFAGTSTGGLIALGLASGLPISQLVNIYSAQNCPNIFKPYNPVKSSNWLFNFLKYFFNETERKELENIENLLYVKYNSTGLEQILKNNLENCEDSLESLTSKVLVTTFQLDNSSGSSEVLDRKKYPWIAPKPSWTPITLDNLPNNPFGSEKTKVIDAALSTSAAPTVFPPHKHPTYGYCVDGGLVANNPSTLALARVLNSEILKERNLEYKDIRVLSVGTGIHQACIPQDYQPKGALRYGLTTWLWPHPQSPTPSFPLLSILMDASSMIDDFQVDMFLGYGQYRRVNPNVIENISLDDCSKIAEMQNLVNEYTTSDDWNKQTSWIKEHLL